MMSAMHPRRHPAIAPALLVILLAGCTPAAGDGGSPGGGGDGGGSAGTEGGGALSCDGVTTGGFELFVDPRLSVSPQGDILPLTRAGEVIEFVDAAFTDGTSYGYDYAYVDGGQAFTQGGAPFFDTEGSPGVDTGGGAFRIEGPLELVTADGGPYAGILTITATTPDLSTTTLANVCVELPAG
jgi:hypothetical protein